MPQMISLFLLAANNNKKETKQTKKETGICTPLTITKIQSSQFDCLKWKT